MPDYLVLLEKYIKHVGYMEGVDFITNRGQRKNEWFSDEEWQQLTEVAYGVWAKDEAN